MGARNRDAAVAASSFIVTHIVVATAQFLIVRAATKRRYRRCCPLLWRCGLLRSRRCAVVTMRSVFPGTAALVRAWNLQNAETRVVEPTENPLTLLITATLSPSALVRAWNLQNAETRVVKPTENPLTLLITATLSPSRRARLTIFKNSFVRGTYKTLRRGLSNLRRTRLPCSSPQRLARRGAHASPFSKTRSCVEPTKR